jgi:hypothetical protein
MPVAIRRVIESTRSCFSQNSDVCSLTRRSRSWSAVSATAPLGWLFTGDYLRDHLTYGYAVTVHSAQGVTADTTHAVLGENTTRVLAYVAMTRGRESNRAYLYQRVVGEADHQHRGREDMHVARRGSSGDAAHLMRNVIAIHDERARTAHDVSATTEREHLPEPIGSLIDCRTNATERRRRDYFNSQEQTPDAMSENERSREQHVSRTSSPDYGIQL